MSRVDDWILPTEGWIVLATETRDICEAFERLLRKFGNIYIRDSQHVSPIQLSARITRLLNPLRTLRNARAMQIRPQILSRRYVTLKEKRPQHLLGVVVVATACHIDAWVHLSLYQKIFVPFKEYHRCHFFCVVSFQIQ